MQIYNYNRANDVCMCKARNSTCPLAQGQVDFPPDNKITNICCPSDNLGRGSVDRQILVSDFNGILLYSDLVRHDFFLL